MTQPAPQLIAQNITNPAFNSLTDLSTTEFFGGLIPALISLGLVIGAVVFLLYFIMGAIHWITSGGDKMKMEQARSKITTALVGIFILLSFVAILSLVEHFFGIGMRRIELGPFHIELTGNANGNNSSSLECPTGEIVCYALNGTSYCHHGSYCPEPN